MQKKACQPIPFGCWMYYNSLKWSQNAQNAEGVYDMKKIDMHIHAYNREVNPETLLGNLESAGLSGCCVFSTRPDNAYPEEGIPFEQRLEEVLSWSRGYEDRIFPVLWIHPFEDNIMEKVRLAVESGVAAFKIICSDFYVSDPRCLEVLREIARLGKPVIFHTGILWDGKVSSDFNRPMHFEALLDIDGLRFSLGHCSWPWVDECIALYGKFVHALHNGKTAEMFFDITPGTPPIYRRELLTKLYTIGYDVGDNILFGTDGTADAYRTQWTSFWLDTDRKILDELGVSRENREKLYYDNIMRFLGKSDKVVSKTPPSFDDPAAWSPVNPQTAVVIRKWYDKLGFPKIYDQPFEKALATIPISDDITIDTYDLDCEDGKRNLLSFLFMCEAVEKRYQELGIGEDILVGTLQDLVRWTNNWSAVKGEMCLFELEWLTRHMRSQLFKVGRLQFYMAPAHEDIPACGIRKGDNVVELHIHHGGKLNPEAVDESLAQGKAFLQTYFPEYEYRYFTCHSWLLDETLRKYLPENSNILHFGNRFQRVAADDDNALLRFLFRWDTNDLNVAYAVCNSELHTKIKNAVLRGEQFHEVLGVIPKDEN